MSAKQEHLKELLDTDLLNLKFTHEAQIRRKEELEREVDRIMVD